MKQLLPQNNNHCEREGKQARPQTERERAREIAQERNSVNGWVQPRWLCLRAPVREAEQRVGESGGVKRRNAPTDERLQTQMAHSVHHHHCHHHHCCFSLAGCSYAYSLWCSCCVVVGSVKVPGCKTDRERRLEKQSTADPPDTRTSIPQQGYEHPHYGHNQSEWDELHSGCETQGGTRQRRLHAHVRRGVCGLLCTGACSRRSEFVRACRRGITTAKRIRVLRGGRGCARERRWE
jgi:hypothetical protein